MRTKTPKDKDALSEQEIVRRRDEAVRRALNTPPKPYKESKVGKVGKAKPKPSGASKKR